MKKIIVFSLILFAFLARAVSAQEVEVHFFYGNGCPHCAKEMEFLRKLQDEFPGIRISSYEIYNNPNNASWLKDKARELGVTNIGVPFLVLDGGAIVGYLSESTTGAEIRQKLLGVLEKLPESGDFVGEEGSEKLPGKQLLGPKEESEEPALEEANLPSEKTAEEGKPAKEAAGLGRISLPFAGEVDVGSWSLPFLTVVLAALDGFNPCAMWVLLFLISLLIGMENRRRMWTLGIAFIASSALVYFLFLSAWLNLFLFIGLISFVRIAIGTVAVGSGIYHFKEWYCNRDGTCHAAGTEKKRKIMDKFCEITGKKNFFAALIGIIAMAFAVNLIELVCSAGLPAIYTHVLSMSDISAAGYYLYLLLYIAVFMLDDLLIFFIAMTSLKMVGVSSQYSRWSNLIGGIVILLLGLLLIFKPGWIMFG